MNNLAYYLIQVMAVSGILYSYFHFCLRNKKFHHYNRFYILIALVVSVVVPFLSIPVYIFVQEKNTSLVFQTLTLISSPILEDEGTGSTPLQFADEGYQIKYLVYFGYLMLIFFFTAKLILSLHRIGKLIRNYPVKKINDIFFVNTREPRTPFSFFNWLFWDQAIELNSKKGEQVFRHELFHIRQKHSFDIIFLELLTILFWINPFFHLFKKELRAIHEFLADQHVASEHEKLDYAELLLMRVLQTENSLVNSFFQNHIKRRITMLTTSQQTGRQYLRKIMALPLLSLVTVFFAFTYVTEKKGHSNANAAGSFTIVIDAGHGGDDPGARSQDGRHLESNIMLELAQQVQRLGKEYQIDVVLTRANNNYPGSAAGMESGLKKRVDIAAASSAGAFISLHMNAAGKNNSGTKGFEAYVALNQFNDSRSAILATALLENVSAFYPTKQHLQRAGTSIYVLDKNIVPSVLLHCGNISDESDLSFITNPVNQEKVARALLTGINKVKDQLARESSN